MNPPRPDFAAAPATGRSTAQTRALRKALLLVRADIERAELGASVAELRETAARLGWLRFVLPALVGVATGLGIRAKSAGGVFGRYPLVGSLLGALVSLFTAGPLGAKAKPAIKWTGLAFGAWETWRTWRQVRRGRRSASSSGANGRQAGE